MLQALKDWNGDTPAIAAMKLGTQSGAADPVKAKLLLELCRLTYSKPPPVEGAEGESFLEAIASLGGLKQRANDLDAGAELGHEDEEADAEFGYGDDVDGYDQEMAIEGECEETPEDPAAAPAAEQEDVPPDAARGRAAAAGGRIVSLRHRRSHGGDDDNR